MEKEVIEALDALAEKAGIAINWSNENVLPYIQDLMDRVVKLELYTSVLFLAIGILLCLSEVLWMKQIKIAQKKYHADKYSCWDLIVICLSVGMIACVVTGIIMMLCQATDIITCLTVPEKIFIKALRTS